jgi:hypothetical protein
VIELTKAKFKWMAWDFDCDGDAYVIAKRECPEKENVPDFICKEDCIHEDCKPDMIVQEGWCKYQVRTDWENGDGEPQGGYYVKMCKTQPITMYGKKKRGWFPVWIVRKGEWY